MISRSHNFKTVGIPRAGLEYQDLIAIELLLNFFRKPEFYRWIEVESEDPSVGSLDDVVAARSDGSFELIQVKFTSDPSRYALDWDWLLERTPAGTSRLAKWADSLVRASHQGPVAVAQLRTNRRPSSELEIALSGQRIDLQRVNPEMKVRLEAELGGIEAAAKFFNAFDFSHSESLIDDLEMRLRWSVVPSDTDREGWLLLRDQVRKWATKKSEPEPDGRIRHQHLVQIITKKRPRPIPQNFLIPAGYRVPRSEFHVDFLAQLRDSERSIIVLWGTPGRGKSTYLSFLVQELTAGDLPFIRHHYFLALDDATNDRMSFTEIASSLIDQIVSRYGAAVEGLEESPSRLRDWIEACGDYFEREGKRFHVFIDGLDHVWREHASIAQMEHLFNHLLPCPPNVTLVVGTQRVPDSQLPARLLSRAHSRDWVEIPSMDEIAVHHWVREQRRAGRVRLIESSPGGRALARQLRVIGTAFFEISAGHPLHLIYSFEALVRRGAIFTEDEIRLLPQCPDGDIVKYYRLLWGRLSEGGKQTLHLIAGSDFHWPPEGLLRCGMSIDESAHLLEHRLTGLVPFHGSILAYARGLHDHHSSFRASLPIAITWLSSEAPNYWRWGWLWLMQAKGGDNDPLLAGATREWVIASLATGHAYRQIIAILSAAEKKAFERGDYCRTVELRSLKTRVDNAPEFQTQRFFEFVESAITSGQNDQRMMFMADEMGTLRDEEVATLARLAMGANHQDLVTDCLEELRRRVNSWIALRHKSRDIFVALARNFMEVLVLAGKVDTPKVVDFIAQFQDADAMFHELLTHLLRRRVLTSLIELSRYLRTVEKPNWLLTTCDAIGRVALMEGVVLSKRVSREEGAVSPLMACCFLKYDEPSPPAVLGSLVNVVHERYEYGRNVVLERFYQRVFFSAFASAVVADGQFSYVLPGLNRAKMGWMSQVVELLEGVARSLAKREVQGDFSLLFKRADAISPVSRDRPTEAAFVQYNSFRRALIQLSVDLHYFSSDCESVSRVETEQLQEVRQSRHWSDDFWIDWQLDNQWKVLAASAAARLFDVVVNEEAQKVSQFNKRADRWIELSRFASNYELSGDEAVIRRASRSLVGYGWRKDLWLSDVLEAIDDVHIHSIADGLPWIRSLVPIVEEVTEFTDGDETDYIRSELIRTVADVCPDHLPALYVRHIARDEWGYAQESLKAFSGLANFAEPVAAALGRTFVDVREIAILRDKAEAGDAGAAHVKSTQLRYLGGLPIELGDGSIAAPGSPDVEDAPAPMIWGPTEFSAMLGAVAHTGIGHEQQQRALRAWLRHWKDQGHGVEALEAIWRTFTTEEDTTAAGSLLDEAFLVAFEVLGQASAYDWLVLAHIELRGWDSQWTSSEKVLRRLGWAAKYYKDRWAQYISDTSRQPRYWERKYSFTIGHRYLIHFLILVGQAELAVQLTATCVRIIQEEVSDQPISSASWFG